MTTPSARPIARPRLLTRREVAQRLGVSLRTLDTLPLWRIEWGEWVRYDPADVEAYAGDRGRASPKRPKAFRDTICQREGCGSPLPSRERQRGSAQCYCSARCRRLAWAALHRPQSGHAGRAQVVPALDETRTPPQPTGPATLDRIIPGVGRIHRRWRGLSDEVKAGVLAAFSELLHTGDLDAFRLIRDRRIPLVVVYDLWRRRRLDQVGRLAVRRRRDAP